MRNVGILIYRALVVNYVLTFLVLTVANVPSVLAAIRSLQESAPLFGNILGWMGCLAAFTFFALLFHTLYHWGTHSRQSFSKVGWFWTIVLLNFLGVVLYYVFVIERERRDSRVATATLI